MTRLLRAYHGQMDAQCLETAALLPCHAPLLLLRAAATSSTGAPKASNYVTALAPPKCPTQHLHEAF